MSMLGSKMTRATAPHAATHSGQFRHAVESHDLRPAELKRTSDSRHTSENASSEDKHGSWEVDGYLSRSPEIDSFSLVRDTLRVPERSLMTKEMFRAALGSKPWTFTCTANSALTSSGAGSFLLTIPISPGVLSYNEYASLSALFDEVKLVSSKVLFIPQVGSNGQNLEQAASAFIITNLIVCGFERDNISTAPANLAAVLRLQGSQPLKQRVGDTVGVGEMSAKARPGLGWARSTTPAVQDPPSGVLGAFMLANSGALSNSTTYFNVVVKTTMQFRNRV